MSSDASCGVHIENTIHKIRKKLGRFIEASTIEVSYSYDKFLYN